MDLQEYISERFNQVGVQLNRMDGRLEKVADKLERIQTEEIPGLRIEIATLKTKAAVWGSVAGFIISSLVALGIGLFG